MKRFLKKVLLEAESLFKENNKRFILNGNILNNYLDSLNKYLKRNLEVEDCQDVFNGNSIFLQLFIV